MWLAKISLHILCESGVIIYVLFTSMFIMCKFDMDRRLDPTITVCYTMSCVMRKRALRSLLSLIVMPKEGLGAWPNQSFFCYDLCTHYRM